MSDERAAQEVLHTTRSKEVVLGQDFGSLHSKLALAFWTNDGDPQLSRVPFSGLLSDPEYPDDVNHDYEFIASAALDETGELVEGRAALDQDVCIPLKTMLIYLAKNSNRNDTILLCPSGTDLLEAVRDGAITPDSIRAVLTTHFQRLRDMALAQAGRNKVKITTLALTYPNFLFAGEDSRDFDRYMDCYLALVRGIWGDEVGYRVVSEGQAAALYICVPFYDSVRGAICKQVENLFDGLDKKSWVNLLVVDSGSSSVNIQSVCVYFDEEGKIRHSQSIIRGHQLAGVQGGSHTANDEVRKIVDSVLQRVRDKGGPVQPGDLAKYLWDFDRRKRERGFNYAEYVRQHKDLTLRINDGLQLRIELTYKQIRSIFGAAHSRGVSAVRTEARRPLANSTDIAALFCGGSYLSAGLRDEVGEAMEAIRETAARKQVRVKYDFLGNFEKTWSTAVAAGAALGVLTMPPLLTLLPGFTVGVQLAQRNAGAKGRWVGFPTAEVLVSEGYGARPCDYKIASGRADAHRLRFYLVADPTYHKGRSRSARASFPDIQILHPRHESQGIEPGPYHLGCTIRALELPAGKVRFELTGKNLKRLARGELEHAVQGDTMPVILSCFKVDHHGRKARDPRDKRWLLKIQVDPAARLPIVAQEQDFGKLSLPFWCSTCRGEIIGQTAQVCPVCTFNLCWDCSLLPGAHNHAHKLKEVAMDI